jgi:DNA-binding response OmpR family regulator
MPGDKEKAQKAGCDDYDTKPVQMPRLLEKIRALLQARGIPLPQPKAAPPKSAPPPAPPVTAAPPAAATPPEAAAPPPVAPPAAPAPAAVAPKLGDSCPVQRKHILVVEDNDPNRELLCRRLAKQGYCVSDAAGGRAALDLIRRERLDLVLLDIMMPEMDGFQVLELLKSDTEMRELPVIMLSALDTMDAVVRCIEMGAEDYLHKPYDPVLLQARITACLDKKRLRDQELAYLRAVADLAMAAAAVEKGAFEPALLEAVAGRDDELGRLARVFERMAREVIAREQQLRQQVEELRVEIDEQRKREQVSEITDNAYFQSLQQKVRQFRRRARKEEGGEQAEASDDLPEPH